MDRRASKCLEAAVHFRKGPGHRIMPDMPDTVSERLSTHPESEEYEERLTQ